MSNYANIIAFINIGYINSGITMGNFWQNFGNGFMLGMFSGMFGGWNNCTCYNFYTPYNSCFDYGNFYLYPDTISYPSLVEYDISCFNVSTNYAVPTCDFSLGYSLNNDMCWNFDTYVFSGGSSSRVENTEKSQTTEAKVTSTVVKRESKNIDQSSPKKEERSIVSPPDDDFDKMLSVLRRLEGGYTDDDCGQAANIGVQQETYNAYRIKNGLEPRDVSLITDAEVRDLYYNEYYKPSGADKIKNVELAYYVFDTAVNMGLGGLDCVWEIMRTKGYDLNSPEDFNKARMEHYKVIAEKPEKKKYLQGWTNRVNNSITYVAETFLA